MKKILITNDDSFEAKGLEILIEAVKDLVEVYVIAQLIIKVLVLTLLQSQNL